jgi:dihydrofolate synthase/folylpolyglutamate synthase
MAYHPATWAVFGMLKDKDVRGVVDAVGHRVDHWLPVSLDGLRGASADELAEILTAAGVAGPLPTFATVAQALAHAREKAGGDDRILVFGSFLTVADALRALGRTA